MAGAQALQDEEFGSQLGMGELTCLSHRENPALLCLQGAEISLALATGAILWEKSPSAHEHWGSFAPAQRIPFPTGLPNPGSAQSWAGWGLGSFAAKGNSGIQNFRILWGSKRLA